MGFFLFVLLCFSPKKFSKQPSSRGDGSLLLLPRGDSGRVLGRWWGGTEMGCVPVGLQCLGRRMCCMTMGLHAGFRLGSVEYAATGYCFFWCKPGWQLTQLSPSTCLVGSFSFPSSPYTQKCTILAVLCSLPHADDFAGADVPGTSSLNP